MFVHVDFCFPFLKYVSELENLICPYNLGPSTCGLNNFSITLLGWSHSLMDIMTFYHPLEWTRPYVDFIILDHPLGSLKMNPSTCGLNIFKSSLGMNSSTCGLIISAHPMWQTHPLMDLNPSTYGLNNFRSPLGMNPSTYGLNNFYVISRDELVQL